MLEPVVDVVVAPPMPELVVLSVLVPVVVVVFEPVDVVLVVVFEPVVAVVEGPDDISLPVELAFDPDCPQATAVATHATRMDPPMKKLPLMFDSPGKELLQPVALMRRRQAIK